VARPSLTVARPPASASRPDSAAGRRRRGRVPRPLALLLALTALLSLAWALVTAPLQGPDEPQHVAYAQHLAETGNRPSPVAGWPPESTQLGALRFYLNLGQLAGDRNARPAWTEAEVARLREILAEQPPSARADGVGPNPLGKNPPVYYGLEALAYHAGGLTGDPFAQLLVMRLLNGLLLVATVAMTWLIAAELFGAAWVRLTAAACVALLPQLGFLSGVVNSDNLLVAGWTALTLAAVRLVRRGPTPARVVTTCAAAAVCLLTHGRGLAAAPALVAVLAVALVRHRPSVRAVAPALAAGAAVLLVAFGLYRLALAPETGAYGGELNAGQTFSVSGLISWTWQFYFPALPFMAPKAVDYGYRQVFIESFFGQFGTLDTPFSRGTYDLIQDLVFLGLVGLAIALWTRRDAVRAQAASALTLLALAGSMFALLHLASYRAVANGGDPLITGRYFLPLVATFGIAVAFGLASLPRRVGPVVAGAVLGGLVALSLGGLGLTLARFYG
jgi:4-amino-4-deoxy-L-arabinose transferase-like glycosyltransferase